MRWRSNRRVLPVLAAIAALTTMLPAVARAADIRLPAGTPRLFPPGFVFGFQQNLRNPEVLARLGGQIATASRRNHNVAIALATMANAAQDGLPRASTDDIAHFATQSYAAVADIVVKVQYLSLVAGRDPALAGLAEEAMATVTLLSGDSVTLRAQTASLGHSNVMHLVDREMAKRPRVANVTGLYAVETDGDCPAMPRALELRQSDYMVEAVASADLVLFGAIGTGQLHLAANSQRYARRRDSADGAPDQYDVPDAPRDRFQAALGAPGTPIVLRSTADIICTLTLLPAT